MATALRFEGFGGLSLAAEGFGSPDNPVVLMLHGGAQTRHSWREAAQALAAAGRYAITLDLRGHGQSGWAADGRYDLAAFAADLRAVLTQMQTRPVVVGASLGGFVALKAMADGGAALASGLVLVDAAPTMSPEGRRALGGVLRRHAAGFASLDDAVQAAREVAPAGRDIDADLLRRQLRHDEHGRWFWMWDPAFLEGFNEREFQDLERSASSLKLPTLALYGSQSRIITEPEVARFQELMPGAEFARIEDAGHLLAAERFESFNASLLEFLERRIPRAPISYESGSDPRTLRDALGCFGTGVVIATTLDAEGETQGLTANSFTSLSLDPPLVLFCVAKTSRSLMAFEQSDFFALNVLHIGQQPDSARFARRAEDRFSAGAWETWDTGAPILSGSLASIECAKYAWYDGGDHVIIVGRVRRARFEPRRDPLLYFQGGYRRLHFL